MKIHATEIAADGARIADKMEVVPRPDGGDSGIYMTSYATNEYGK